MNYKRVGCQSDFKSVVVVDKNEVEEFVQNTTQKTDNEIISSSSEESELDLSLSMMPAAKLASTYKPPTWSSHHRPSTLPNFTYSSGALEVLQKLDNPTSYNVKYHVLLL